jgi:hypothetical protein
MEEQGEKREEKEGRLKYFDAREKGSTYTQMTNKSPSHRPLPLDETPA